MKLAVFLLWLSGALMGYVFTLQTDYGVGEMLGWLLALVLGILPLYLGIRRLRSVIKKGIQENATRTTE